MTWALVETNDGSVYRMGVGEYLGLFNGRIVKVTSQSVEVIELIPDGSGCWSERSNSIVLSGE
jgi:type IV pilus assembly protein PilP